MNNRIQQFDSKLFALRVERSNVAVELKSVEIEELRMMSELEILEEFQAKGEKLKTRLQEGRNAKSKVFSLAFFWARYWQALQPSRCWYD